MDLQSIYEFYHSMKYYGRYGFDEIDNMLPFERDIYFGLLVETKEKENKT